MPEQADAVAAVCRALTADGAQAAAHVVRARYPFDPQPVVKRKYGPRESIRVFIRDGFVDQYSGQRLVFPPVLRVLSNQLPEAFPFHPAWKTDVTHPAFAELGATIDHLVPITRGGTDDESNLVTTSMNRNFAKMNATLDELGWKRVVPDESVRWDGLLGWFSDYVEAHPDIRQIASVNR